MNVEKVPFTQKVLMHLLHPPVVRICGAYSYQRTFQLQALYCPLCQTMTHGNS